MRRVLMGLVAMGALAACVPGLGDCAMRPLAAARLAAVGPAGGWVEAPVATSCASKVAFEGRTYFLSGGDDTWSIAIDDLEPIGAASAANEPAWEDATVYAIEGVDPGAAVAMRYGSGAAVAVLLAADMPGSLCPFVTDPGREPACASSP